MLLALGVQEIQLVDLGDYAERQTMPSDRAIPISAKALAIVGLA
jgi:hypothetical protein